MVIDSALYRKRISVDKSNIVMSGSDVGHLRVEAATLVDKDAPPPTSPKALTKLAQSILAPHFPGGRFDGIDGGASGGGGPVVAANPAAVAAAAPRPAARHFAASRATVSGAGASGGAVSGGDGAAASNDALSSSYVYFAGLSATGVQDTDRGADRPARTPNEEAKVVMSQLQRMLSAHTLTAADVMLVHLYVADMATFAEINSIYIATFGTFVGAFSFTFFTAFDFLEVLLWCSSFCLYC